MGDYSECHNVKEEKDANLMNFFKLKDTVFTGIAFKNKKTVSDVWLVERFVCLDWNRR